MRIVHITTVPESLMSYLRGQVEFLAGHGIEITAISSPGPHLDDFAAEQHADVIGIEMRRQITPLRDLVALAKVVRALRAVAPTIVHAHTPKGGLLGMLGGLLAGTPVRIYHMRGLPLETATGWRKALLRWTERASCAAATEVLCVSGSLRAVALTEHLTRPEKIRVLGGGSGQGVDATGKFDPGRLPAGSRAATRARLGIPDDAVALAFVGRVTLDKGVRELAAAWADLRTRFPRVYLVLAGVIEDRDERIADALAQLRADDRVRMLGFDWNTAPIYDAADVVVLPTYREGFPNVPLEAGAMERPVVSTLVAGCIDAIVDGETGLLVPPHEPAALAVALARYVEDPLLRARHGRAGRARVLSTFRRELVWEEIYERYRALAPNGAR